MIYYNGIRGKHYFEGWFFRVCAEGLNCALIPSVSVADGERRAFIQVNCNGISQQLQFPFEEFHADDRQALIGENRFSSEGIRFACDGLTLEADFGEFTPLKSDIMGCFKFGTPCKHRIISMKHAVTLRRAVWNGRELLQKSAVGYAEKDWGKSFPKAYCWLQCNQFDREDVSFFCSVADIGFPFRGLICALLVDGREYRFATYDFARIKCLERGSIALRRGKHTLLIGFA